MTHCKSLMARIGAEVIDGPLAQMWRVLFQVDFSRDHLHLSCIAALVLWWDVCCPPPYHQTVPSTNEGTSWLSPQ